MRRLYDKMTAMTPLTSNGKEIFFFFFLESVKPIGAFPVHNDVSSEVTLHA